jgi:hypothetical protein
LDVLKEHFDVTNQYVLQKIKIIYLPFLLKDEDWKQRPGDFQYYNGTDLGSQEEKPSPRNDLQAPDLYIPIMSFVTFIILVGVAQGTLNDT